jgi:O-methyltransferase
MLSIARKICHLVVPPSLRLHLHLFRKHNRYVFLSKESLGYAEDGLYSRHAASFLGEDRFCRAYSLGERANSWGGISIRWRVHVLLWCASCSARLPGAFVECGVNRGGFAKAIIDYTAFGRLKKHYYLFDTFSGFDVTLLNSEERETIGKEYRYDDCYDAVQKEFADKPFVVLIRGSVPASLSKVEVGSVAFLSIDMNCVAPEIAAARFFWPKMVPGGMILLDDYGFSQHHLQKAAFDELAREWGVEILSLPTGQGLIIKPGEQQVAS